MAAWPSGKAEDCKSFIPSSNLGAAFFQTAGSSSGCSRQSTPGLATPDGLSGGMEGALQITNQLLQSFASAPGGRQVIGNHSRVAEIQQQSGLLGREAQQVLVVVVDDFHQVRKQH
jgi:hypothetical protein